MTLWTAYVELLQGGIFTLAQALGGNLGAGILCLSVILRLALMPLTLRLARRSLAHRELMLKLRPELERIQRRFRKQPERLMEESGKLFAAHGARPVDGSGLLGGLVQAPVALGLFSAVRKSLSGSGGFLWIVDLARPDALLAVLAAALTWLTATLQPALPEQGRALVIALPAVMTLVFLWRMAAGLGLYWAASTAVGLLQNLILRRRPAMA